MVNLATLPDNARKLVIDTTEWLDPFWDPAYGLLWAPGIEKGPRTPLRHHMVRDTIWYVVGLFLRRQGSDVLRGLQSIKAILEHQFDAHGLPYHGTFRRSPEEADPGVQAVEWVDYDPNWREFICTVLDLLMIEFPDLIPPKIKQQILHSFRLAVEGSLARGLKPNYTNIALMHAYLLCQAGLRLNEPEWVKKGEAFAKETYRLFNEHGAFEEYNSPTYYGVDLFALALWRKYKPTPVLAQLGSDMEERLWTDISRYYHPTLRTMCGPFDRAYDMDMRKAVGVLGEWIYLVTGAENAPLPDVTRYFDHTTDICFAPCAAILGVKVPKSILKDFQIFSEDRSFSQTITSNPLRYSSAWLSKSVMVGCEHTSFSKKGYSQFHPLTIHWVLPNSENGWIRARHVEPLNASVKPGEVTVSFYRKIEFEIFCGDSQSIDIKPSQWILPGLSIQVTLPTLEVTVDTRQQTSTYSIIYSTSSNESVNLVLHLTSG